MTPLFLSTSKALLAPRRLIPITVLCTALLMAQFFYDPRLDAAATGVVLCLLTGLIAPFAWRACFHPDATAPLWLRLTAYITTGTTPSLVALIGEDVFGVAGTFLTQGPDLVVATALFLVGGWGLGRDIALEHEVTEAEARAAALALQAEHARLLAIQAHLDPHFLFNTLNAIAEWCVEDGVVAEQAVLRLSGLLREILHGVNHPWWSLEREIELARDLLALHLIRDPHWFEIHLDLPDPIPGTQVPPMFLLPLVENAVKHGPASGHRGPLRLSIAGVGDRLHITLDNPGAFMGRRTGGEGLRMVEQRLLLAYAGRARLTIGTCPSLTASTRATLDLPLQSVPSEASCGS